MRKSIGTALFFTVLMATLSYPKVWAQRGIWDGHTLANMKNKYTDQQIGGFLLHEASSLLEEASQALMKARNPDREGFFPGF